jgi:hypothetical protein
MSWSLWIRKRRITNLVTIANRRGRGRGRRLGHDEEATTRGEENGEWRMEGLEEEGRRTDVYI